MKDLMQIQNELKAPFHPDDIEWRVGSTTKDKTKGLALAYITNRAIQNRLDDVFGIAGWKNEFRDWKGSGVLCGLSCFVNDQWITKWDGAEETNMEATKGGISDAMKRAGYQWGIGRYLYKLESQWVEIDPRGSSYVIRPGKEPKLPIWALPEGFTYMPSNQQPKTAEQPKPQTKSTEEEVIQFLNEVRLGDQESLKPEDLGTLVCSECHKPIDEAVRKWSVDKYGRQLCRPCQGKAKKQTA